MWTGTGILWIHQDVVGFFLKTELIITQMQGFRFAKKIGFHGEGTT